MAIDKITLQATDNLFVNTEITGTEAAKMPVGTTAQRANVQAGDIRFNSTISLMEYYDGVQWKSIDSPPQVASISPSNIADSDSSVDIVITGSNFISGGQTVTAIGSDGSTISASTVTRDSNTQVTANFDGTSFDNAQEPYDIKVENNNSGLSTSLGDALNVNASPAWTVSAGSLGTIYDIGRTGVSITTGATDDEADTLTYSVSVGSLPAGLSISSSTGTISGTATAVGSDTTSTFTLSVTDGANTTTRQYSITVAAPVVTSYTSTGSGTFTVPSGVTTVDALVVAGGGAGGNQVGGGGGAGGVIYRPAFPVTPGSSVSYTVGSGGNPTSQSGPLSPAQGQNSVFGSLTAIGGGAGGAYPSQSGLPGGSGGGADGDNPSGVGQGTQPQQPGDSGSPYGTGTPGGAAYPSQWGGGGGGGAATSGANASASQGGNGGNGRQIDISGSQVYYGGGGGGCSDTDGITPNNGAGGQGGGGRGGTNNPTSPLSTSINPDSRGADPGAANRGGGGGGGRDNGGANNPGGDNFDGGSGGSGIVIVKY